MPEKTPASAKTPPSGTSSGLPESLAQGLPVPSVAVLAAHSLLVASKPAPHPVSARIATVPWRSVSEMSPSAAVSPQPRTVAAMPGAQRAVSPSSTTRMRSV